MKLLEEIKERRENSKRIQRSVSLPKGKWEQYQSIADENGLNINEIVEAALLRFEAELQSTNTMPTETA